jgi:hypothetical protein
MTCHDAREKLSALRRGMDLTERALVHAHMMQCAECRKEREEQLEPIASSPTVAAQAALTVAGVARAGAARTAGLLTQVEHVRSGLTRAGVARTAGLLTQVEHMRSGLTRAGVASTAGLLTQVEHVRSGLTRAGVASTAGLLTQVEHVRSELTRAVHMLVELRSPLMTACQAVARATTDFARAGVPRVLDVLARLRELSSIALTVSGQAAMRVVEVVRTGVARSMALSTRVSRQLPGLLVVAGRAGATLIGHARFGIARISGRLISFCSPWMSAFPRAGRTTTAAARAGVTRAFELPTQLIAAGRALSVRAAQASPPGPKQATAWPVRPLLSTGMVGLVILVAAIVLSAGERLSRDVRLPVDLEPSFAETSTSIPVAGVQPAPVEASPPVPRPVRVRPRSPEPAQAATALTPPTEATAQNADASDPTAAIDWLLQGGRRRQTVSP